MSEFNIALIPGDGIGPEIVAGAVTVLDAVSEKFGAKFNYTVPQYSATVLRIKTK